MTDNLFTRKKYILDVFGEDPSTLDDLANCCIAVCNSEAKQNRRIKLVGFAWDVNHGKVSNSHYCPINGTINFGSRDRDRNKPTSYQGWIGRVWLRYQDDYGNYPSSKTLTYPGTGGAGSYDGPWSKVVKKWHYDTYEVAKKWHNATYEVSERDRRITSVIPQPKCCGFDFRFFDADWPLIDDWAQKNGTFHRIATNKEWRYNHKFFWMDEETKQYDEYLLQEG